MKCGPFAPNTSLGKPAPRMTSVGSRGWAYFAGNPFQTYWPRLAQIRHGTLTSRKSPGSFSGAVARPRPTCQPPLGSFSAGKPSLAVLNPPGIILDVSKLRSKSPEPVDHQSGISSVDLQQKQQTHRTASASARWFNAGGLLVHPRSATPPPPSAREQSQPRAPSPKSRPANQVLNRCEHFLHAHTPAAEIFVG
jgi:hypothetical protein